MIATNYTKSEQDYAEEVLDMCMYISEKYERYITIERTKHSIIAREYTSILCDTNSWTGELFYFSSFRDMDIFLLGYYAGLKTR